MHFFHLSSAKYCWASCDSYLPNIHLYILQKVKRYAWSPTHKITESNCILNETVKNGVISFFVFTLNLLVIIKYR